MADQPPDSEERKANIAARAAYFERKIEREAPWFDFVNDLDIAPSSHIGGWDPSSDSVGLDGTFTAKELIVMGEYMLKHAKPDENAE